MVDIKVLKKHGVSSEAYKKIFCRPPEEYERPVRRLVDLITNRIKDGRGLNLKEWRAYHAIDLAYDVPFNQTTPTLLSHIASKHLNVADTQQMLDDYGLSREELFLNIEDQHTGQITPMLNLPVFFQVYVPLVKSYSTMRLANMFNQRNTNPLLLYNPLKMSERDQVSCEIVTDMINDTATTYGYAAVLRQALQQMIKYGLMLAFPREEWDCQRQLMEVDGIEKKTITREGIRYFIPHPTRMYFDLKHPLTSLNTDTGTEFVGAWHILSYGDILDNRLYWNRSRIFCGTNWFEMPGIGQYFKKVYPCNQKFPVPGWNMPTREDTAAWYNSGDRDQSVFVTQHFQRLIPKQFGLADYPHPVWHRFTMAGDDTVIWAEPCAYVPSWFMGWDYDENASKTSSMALECIPWQDTLGNILSQMLLTAKQNLANVVFYDESQINKGDIEKLRNKGEDKYRATTYIGFNSLAARMAQHGGPPNAFFPVKFEKQTIQELLQLIPTVLTIMERVLQITAQESGAAASHQQSKEEVVRTGNASNARVTFSFSYVDEGIDAWKQQQFDAHMAYRESDLEAQVDPATADIDEILSDLGFSIVKRGKDRLIIRGKKTAVRLQRFARTSEGQPLASDKEAAAAILQGVNVISSQEELRAKIGSRNILAMLEFAMKLAGAPRELRLREAPKDEQGQAPPPANVIEAIKAAQQATMQAIEEKIGQPAAQEVAKVQGEVTQLQQVVQQLQKIYQFAQADQEKTTIKAKEAQTKDALRTQAAAKEQERKDVAFAKEQHRQDVRTQAELQREAEKTAAQIEMEKKVAAAKADTAAKSASSK